MTRFKMERGYITDNVSTEFAIAQTPEAQKLIVRALTAMGNTVNEKSVDQNQLDEALRIAAKKSNIYEIALDSIITIDTLDRFFKIALREYLSS